VWRPEFYSEELLPLDIKAHAGPAARSHEHGIVATPEQVLRGTGRCEMATVMGVTPPSSPIPHYPSATHAELALAGLRRAWITSYDEWWNGTMGCSQYWRHCTL